MRKRKVGGGRFLEDEKWARGAVGGETGATAAVEVEVASVGEDAGVALPPAPARTPLTDTGAGDTRREATVAGSGAAITGRVFVPHALRLSPSVLTFAVSPHTLHHSSGKTTPNILRSLH